MITPGLSARSRHILKSLVDLYIASGEPVGSKTLSQLPDLAYSPATIRNVMAELENAGLIHSPHTSAGRIPTRQGYRLFVDSLLTVRPLEQAVLEQVRALTQHQPNPQAMMQAASQVLSGLTKMAGVVTTPRKNRTTLRQIEFLKLSRQRVLVILVLNQAEVQNRIIITPKEFSQSELTEAGNYLTHHFSGHELTSIHPSLVDKMQADKDTIDQRMAMVINAAHNSLQVADDRDYMVAGHSHLVGMVDQDVNRLKELFDIFAQKQQVLQLLDQSLSADGVQIYIGEESGFEALGACSVVRAPYHIDQQTVGMIGVIGPTRMAYDKVIPLVDMTAKIVSIALQEAQ